MIFAEITGGMTEIIEEKVELFKKANDKITVFYEGIELTSEEFLKQYIRFVSECMFADKHNIIITQHNGSEVYDALMLLCIVVALLSMNDLLPKDIIDLLEEGQLVTQGEKQERMIFVGKSDMHDGYYTFRDKDNGLKHISAKSFATIVPYYGNAKELGTRGAGDQHTSYEFQKDVFKYSDEQATSFVNTTVVIVAEHGYFDKLLEGIRIAYKGKEYEILDLIGVSFFTDENENVYSGNANKLEANIKVARTMSTARDLLLNKEENEIIGFCALGLGGVKNTVGELEEALKRKKLCFSAINYDIAEDDNALYGLMLEDNLPEYKLYSCTKDFLLSYYLGLTSEKGFLKKFDECNNRIIDKEIKCSVIPSHISWKEVLDIYRMLGDLRKQFMNDDEVVKFVIQAYGLLKLMFSAIVPLKEFEDKGGIDVEYITPHEKIMELKEFIPSSESVSKYTDVIIQYIERVYDQLYESNPKADYLCKTIDRDKRTVVIADKAYYRPIIKRYYAKRGLHNSFTTNTESNAKGVLCDELYIVGKRDDNNIFNWNNSAIQEYVLYDGEYSLFAWQLKKHNSKIALFNEKSFYEIDVDEQQNTDIVENYENTSEAIEEIESIEVLEQNFMIQSAILRSSSLSGEANSIPAEITRVAVCETGESIYFTKYFKALVLDLEKNQVREEDTKDIKSGDSIIFTINNGQTKDIAELVLSKYAHNRNNEKLIEAMADVKAWKEHLSLIRDEKKLTYGEMCGLFKKSDYGVTPATIRTWIDSDCHVVGPINDDAYYAMAKIFESEQMLDEFVGNPKKYIESTHLVRSQRTKILEVIADVIVAKYTGKEIKLDASFEGAVTEDITNLSVLKRIAQIQDVEPFEVPNSKANKPVVM